MKKFRRLIIDKSNNSAMLALSEDQFNTLTKGEYKKVNMNDKDQLVYDLFGYTWFTWYKINV